MRARTTGPEQSPGRAILFSLTSMHDGGMRLLRQLWHLKFWCSRMAEIATSATSPEHPPAPTGATPFKGGLPDGTGSVFQVPLRRGWRGAPGDVSGSSLDT